MNNDKLKELAREPHRNNVTNYGEAILMAHKLEIESLRKQITLLESQLKERDERIERLLKENHTMIRQEKEQDEMLKEAMEVIGFYADHGNWKNTNEKCQCDGFIVGSDLWHPLSHAAVCTRPYGGKRAREYLSKLKKEQG